MASVKFTSNLKRFYPELTDLEVKGETVADVLSEIERSYNGLKDYIIDETGAVRQHVNIYIGNNLIKDREYLSDQLSAEDEVYIMQAISGG
ncbi:MoaD/ThiS family protein [Roseivirga sp.]|uniref:MoaD/ThiS family protein n=1 Tax=Roseivirga sp. TaxID=1964215 RepID=UPI003B8AB400